MINDALIFEYIHTNKLTRATFCKLCGISYTAFRKILSGKAEDNIKALFKIARLLNVQICDLFIK